MVPSRCLVRCFISPIVVLVVAWSGNALNPFCAISADPSVSDDKSEPPAETKTQSDSKQSLPYNIPLNRIWGGRLQGTRVFGQLDLDMPRGVNTTALGMAIDKALATIPTEAAKPGFVVLGKSGEALQGAYGILSENKSPLQPVPANAEVSLVFFGYGGNYSAHLHDVQADGQQITVHYQFVPEPDSNIAANFALISLGKLSEGEYHVQMTQLPMDEKYVKRSAKPPTDEDARRLVCQSFSFSVEPTYIAYTKAGLLDGVGGAEFRFGTRDRMIFVDDIWELDRYARLIPDLPWIDLRKESLLVLMSWKGRPRSIDFIHSEGDTLVIGVKEAPSPTAIADSYHPPQYLVARLPVWRGPVRFEVNGKRWFTIVRGDELNQRADQIWEEILDLHSGGRVSGIGYVHYLQNLSPDISDDQAIKEAFDKQKLFSTPAKAIYPILFQELIDIRARPAIPRIFELIQATGKFDPILEHTTSALVGIGGPDLDSYCQEALKSWNSRSREAAMGVLAAVGNPATRPMAYDLMNGPDIRSIRGGLSILSGIGLRKEDVPTLVRSMKRLESIMFNAPNDNRGPGFEGSSSDDMCAFIYTLAELGAQAEDALPALEQMATKPRFPLSTTLQEPAQKAVEKIKKGLSKSSP